MTTPWTRKLRMGMVGGGQGAFIGGVHRIALAPVAGRAAESRLRLCECRGVVAVAGVLGGRRRVESDG